MLICGCPTSWINKTLTKDKSGLNGPPLSPVPPSPSPPTKFCTTPTLSSTKLRLVSEHPLPSYRKGVSAKTLSAVAIIFRSRHLLHCCSCRLSLKPYNTLLMSEVTRIGYDKNEMKMADGRWSVCWCWWETKLGKRRRLRGETKNVCWKKKPKKPTLKNMECDKNLEIDRDKEDCLRIWRIPPPPPLLLKLLLLQLIIIITINQTYW